MVHASYDRNELTSSQSFITIGDAYCVGCVEDCGATVFLPICDITSSTVVDVFSICTILYNEGQRLEAFLSDAFSQSVK